MGVAPSDDIRSMSTDSLQNITLRYRVGRPTGNAIAGKQQGDGIGCQITRCKSLQAIKTQSCLGERSALQRSKGPAIAANLPTDHTAGHRGNMIGAASKVYWEILYHPTPWQHNGR